MKRYFGTEKGPEGTYFNLVNGEFVRLEDGVTLPGNKEDNYVKVPSTLAVLTGPFVGLSFVIFLPAIGIIAAAGFVGYQSWKAMLKLTERIARVARIGAK